MAKGFYTQTVVVLFELAPAVEALRAALAPGFEVVKSLDGGDDAWFGGPGLLVAYRREVNGALVVDVVDRPWPDDMGDPKDGTSLFGAWTLGQLGPLTFPGNLARAAQQAWRWRDGAPAAVAAHQGFVRLRLTYVGGASQDAPVMPRDCDPVHELEFLTRAARALLDLPSALAFFVPGGEILLSRELLDGISRHFHAHGLPPVAAWCNLRLFNLDGGWSLMDTVGNWQLDLPDMEAAFPKGSRDLGEVDEFLRNATDYHREKGADIVKDGETMDLSGRPPWRGLHFEDSLLSPPRRVLRWIPVDAPDVPQVLGKTRAMDAPATGAEPPRRWWRRWMGR